MSETAQTQSSTSQVQQRAAQSPANRAPSVPGHERGIQSSFSMLRASNAVMSMVQSTPHDITMVTFTPELKLRLVNIAEETLLQVHKTLRHIPGYGSVPQKIRAAAVIIVHSFMNDLYSQNKEVVKRTCPYRAKRYYDFITYKSSYEYDALFTNLFTKLLPIAATTHSGSFSIMIDFEVNADTENANYWGLPLERVGPLNLNDANIIGAVMNWYNQTTEIRTYALSYGTVSGSTVVLNRYHPSIHTEDAFDMYCPLFQVSTYRDDDVVVMIALGCNVYNETFEQVVTLGPFHTEDERDLAVPERSYILYNQKYEVKFSEENYLTITRKQGAQEQAIQTSGPTPKKRRLQDQTGPKEDFEVHAGRAHFKSIHYYSEMSSHGITEALSMTIKNKIIFGH